MFMSESLWLAKTCGIWKVYKERHARGCRCLYKMAELDP